MDGASSAGSKSCSFSPSPITPENSTPNDQTNANVHEHEGDMPPPPPHPPRSTRRMKSEVWNHFEKLTINGEQKAKCLHCSHLFSGNSKNGTSHLKDHLELRCTKKNVKIDVRQQLLSFNRKQDSSTRLENYNFSQEVSRKELSNMVILHEYPLSIVEHIGFRTFVNSLNPNFKIMSRNTLKSDILRMFASEKVNLKKLFDDHVERVAITTDMWTATHQKKGYMAITSHFIDEYWVLRNKTLRFVYVPHPHTAIMLAQVLVDTMNMYNIAEKISSVVLDNCSTNDAMVEILQDKFDYDALLCSGEFFHVRCCAHILNLIVQDGLDVIGPGIERIRNCIAFWCGSAKRIEKFEDKARASKVDCSKKLSLDCKTRWNSTFLMLQSALPYKNVFASLKTQNPKFKFVLPNQRDWELAEMICEKLVKFHEATELFSGRKYPTANLFFRQVCEIKLALLEWEKDVEQVIRDMATTMMEKFDKYWSNINGILAVAAILDPRDKLECVEFYFSEIYGERCHVEVDRIKGLLYDLLNEYHDKSGKDGSTFASTSTTSTYIGTTLGKRTSSSSSSSTGTDKWSQMKKTKKRKANVRCEFDHYLEDETLPESSEFDVLNFWKTDLKYPTLRKIAKDILAIPASTVASESAFSIGGRVVSPQRSSLHANTIEALMCMQNWILGEYSENSLKNSQACATILEDVDVGDEGNGTTSTSEVIDVNSDGEDMEI